VTSLRIDPWFKAASFQLLPEFRARLRRAPLRKNRMDRTVWRFKNRREGMFGIPVQATFVG
jgi:hypothetical protein